MKFGGAMFFTDYSMTGPDLAVALEQRGFDSVWAPEHSHIPLSRKTPFPGGGELPKQYADAMDPSTSSLQSRTRHASHAGLLRPSWTCAMRVDRPPGL